MSLRTLLLYDATFDPFFASLSPTNRDGIYRKAADVIAYILKEFGQNQLEQWLDTPFIYEAGDVAVRSFVNTFGIEPECIDIYLQELSHTSQLEAPNSTSCDQGYAEKPGDPPPSGLPLDATEPIRNLRELDAELSVELSTFIEGNIPVGEQRLAELRAKLNRLESNSPSSANLSLCQCYLEIIHLLELLRNAPIAYHLVSTQHSRIKVSLERGIGRYPDDPRFVCLAATYEFMSPPPYGGGTKGAKDILDGITGHEAQKAATYAIWKKLRPTAVLG